MPSSECSFSSLSQWKPMDAMVLPLSHGLSSGMVSSVRANS